MASRLILIGLVLVLFACKQESSKAEIVESSMEIKKLDTYFHYSIWWAFVNKVFDADLTVKELKQRGDTGLGSFNLLDGELVMIDGVAYRVRENGEITEGADTDKIVYANAAFFEEEKSFDVEKQGLDVETLKTEITKQLPSPNFFYVFEIKGIFDYMKCGGLNKQDRPFDEGLDTLIPNRPIFEGKDLSGTIVGFYCPDFIGNINVQGFHFHFISDDKKLGGHVMEFKTNSSLKIGLDKKTDYHFYLPDNADFESVGFDKEFQYQEKK